MHDDRSTRFPEDVARRIMFGEPIAHCTRPTAEGIMSDRHSRRDFMGLAAAGAAGVLAPGSLHAARLWQNAQSADADLVVFNARVYTMDPAMPRAEAFATKGGRFIAAGKTVDIKGLIGKGTQTFDA